MVVFLHVLTTESFCSVIFASHTMCMHVQKMIRGLLLTKILLSIKMQYVIVKSAHLISEQQSE